MLSDAKPALLAPPVDAGQPSLLARCSGVAPDVLTVVTLLYWATGLTWGFGGRSPRVLSFAAVLLLSLIHI